MKFYSIVIILLFSFPLFSSWANGIDMILSYRNKIDTGTDRIKKVLVFFYICTGLEWFVIILLQYNWEIYNYISSFYFSLSLLWALLFYHFVFLITSVGKEESFPKIQYLVPLFFFVVLLVYPYFRPFNITFITIDQQVVVDSNYKNSSFAVYLLAVFRRLYMIMYCVFCYIRIRRFKSIAPKESRFTKWLWIAMGFFFVITLSIVLRIFNYGLIWHVISFAIIAISLVMLQSLICFNILNGNFRLLNKPVDEEEDTGKRKYTSFQKVRYKTYDNKKKRVRVFIDRSDFENYFKRKKPYLDSKLTIDDLAESLGACRSIISSFVNQTYKMNFSWYVNWWRLKEMERLMKMKINYGKDPRELVTKAGFGSYRNYQRVKSYFETEKKSADECN